MEESEVEGGATPRFILRPAFKDNQPTNTTNQPTTTPKPLKPKGSFTHHNVDVMDCSMAFVLNNRALVIYTFPKTFGSPPYLVNYSNIFK